mmetsp:Transcript_9959/g.28744  ORF Transcript_9959/g.28744 Transcript_9959/m.28744 type:complete len:437 (+) Transcript_9959:258-1568(+)
MAAASSSHAAAVSRGWKRSNDLDKELWCGRCDNASRQLCKGIIRRTLTSGQDVLQLIQRDGADPKMTPSLCAAPPPAPLVVSNGWGVYSLLSLAIDDMTGYTVPAFWAEDVPEESPVALRWWSSPELQDEIMRALIDGGADVDGEVDDFDEDAWVMETLPHDREAPIRVAIASGNQRAIDFLLERDAKLRGLGVLSVPKTLPADQPTEAYEDWLLSRYRQLLCRHPTLATEEVVMDCLGLTVHAFSQAFVDMYINLLVTHGADITAPPAPPVGVSRLCEAAFRGCHQVVTSLCRRLTAEDINAGGVNAPDRTPLLAAVEELGGDSDYGQRLGVPCYQRITRTLLRAGADISRIPTDTEKHRRCRQLVLPEYVTVLNELRADAMAAINAALRPQRSFAALLTHLMKLDPLPFGPQEAEAIAWRTAAFCFEWDRTAAI